jgi:hypothetical protein
MGSMCRRSLLFRGQRLCLRAGWPDGSGPFAVGCSKACRESIRETVVEETVALLAPALRDEEGNWTGDYVRLRFIASA